MSRLLLVIAGAAVVVALGGTVYVAVTQNSGQQDASPTVSADTRDAQEDDSQGDASPLQWPQAEAAKPDEMIEPEVAVDNSGDVDQLADGEAVTTEVDLAALVDDLSSEQAQVLYKVVKKRERRRRVQEARYWLPSDQHLRTADLNLSEEQRQQIAAIKDDLKPSMDRALAGVRAQFDDWGQRQRELWSNAKTMGDQRNPEFVEQMQAMSREHTEIREQQSQLQEPLDQQYMDQVQEVLTPEQAATLEDSIAQQREQQEENAGHVATGQRRGRASEAEATWDVDSALAGAFVQAP